MTEPRLVTLHDLLESVPGLTLSQDQTAIEAGSRDFGGLVTGAAAGVVRPESIHAVERLVDVARNHRISLTPRGLGLSQSGQAVPRRGIAVDMTALDKVEVLPEAKLVRCEAGATWRSVLARTQQHGLAPEVLPLNLDITIGGLLAAGGMGSTSHRFGMAVSSVEEVVVVTGGGDHVVASRSERPDVYDAVLGGVGRYGFICSALVRLRQVLPQTRTYVLLYRDLDTLLADEALLMQQPWCTHLEGFASAAMLGLRRANATTRVPFARWFFGLQVSTEFDPGNEPDDSRLIRGLSHAEHVHTEDDDSFAFADRYALRFQMMKATGAWHQRHPWVEVLLSAETAARLLPDILHRLPLFLGDGHRIMPVADVVRPSYLVHPEGPGPVIAFGVLPASIPAPVMDAAMGSLERLHDELVAAGGRRYLSGWLFEPGEADWRAHYGALYERTAALKADLDPDGILTSRLFTSG